MKPFAISLALTLSSGLVLAQPRISYVRTAVSSTQYNNGGKVSPLDTNKLIKVQSQSITVPIKGKKPMRFNTTPEMEEFHYIGDIKGTTLSVIQVLHPNDEIDLVINRSTGVIDSLIAPPVFSDDGKEFACLNNPGTDEEQRIQIGEIRNGAVHIKGVIRIGPNTFDDINCVKKGALLARTGTSGKKYYYKISYRTH